MVDNKIKIVSLKVEQLKSILRQNNLPTTGSKAELIQRLSEFIGTDEIVEIEEPPNESGTIQDQLDQLRAMMNTMMSAIAVAQVPVAQPQRTDIQTPMQQTPTTTQQISANDNERMYERANTNSFSERDCRDSARFQSIF